MTFSETHSNFPDNVQIADESMWKETRFTLPLQLGEFDVSRLKFRALKNTAHFLNVQPVDSPHPPKVCHSSNAVIAVNLSCPINIELPRVAFVDGCLRYVTWQYKRQYVSLQGNFSAYEKNFSSKTRSTLRRKVRKFVEASGTEDVFRVFRTPDEIETFLKDAKKVSRKSYQERLFDQGIQDSEVYRKQLVSKARSHTIIGWVLYTKNTPVAYTLGEVVSDQAILYGTTGYDPSYAMLSPGTVLQYFVIQNLFNSDEYHIYDLCMGEADHKRLFSNAEQLCADIIFLKHTYRNWRLFIIHISFSSINNAAIRLLDVLGVKKLIKKMIRRWGS